MLLLNVWTSTKLKCLANKQKSTFLMPCAFQCIIVTSNMYKSMFKILHVYLCTFLAESNRSVGQLYIPGAHLSFTWLCHIAIGRWRSDHIRRRDMTEALAIRDSTLYLWIVVITRDHVNLGHFNIILSIYFIILTLRPNQVKVGALHAPPRSVILS